MFPFLQASGQVSLGVREYLAGIPCLRCAGLSNSISFVLLLPFPLPLKLQKGAQLTDFRQWVRAQYGLARPSASSPWLAPFPQMQGPLCRRVPVSLLSLCLCPSFPSHPPLHQILSSCIRRPLGKPFLASQAKERTLSTVPPRQGSHDIAGPVIESPLFLYPLGFLCALAEPRCLQALPRPTSLGQCHGF